MKVILENIVPGASNIWKAEVDPNNLINLSKPKHQQGEINVLMVENVTYMVENRTLQFDLESAILLNLGNSVETIIIDGRKNESDTQNQRQTVSEDKRISTGDEAFLKDLERLPSVQKEIGRQILSEIRKAFAGELQFKPKSGKFIESPDNFWVVKVQPRDKSLRIVVYGEPEKHDSYEYIVLKKDMSSYSNFVVNSSQQTQEAVKVIKAAKRMKNFKK